MISYRWNLLRKNGRTHVSVVGSCQVALPQIFSPTKQVSDISNSAKPPIFSVFFWATFRQIQHLPYLSTKKEKLFEWQHFDPTRRRERTYKNRCNKIRYCNWPKTVAQSGTQMRQGLCNQTHLIAKWKIHKIISHRSLWVQKKWTGFASKNENLGKKNERLTRT